MNSRLWHLLIVIVSLMAGCSLAPQYSRPDAPIAEEWPKGAAYRAQPTTPAGAALTYQEFFADVKLLKVIDLALENNRDLRLAGLNVERARALYGIQRTQLLPVVNTVAAGGKQQRSVDLLASGNSRTVEQYGVNLGIAAWEIDFFGRIRSLKDQALAAYLATEQARRAAQISLSAEVARVYLTLAADLESYHLAQATLAARQQAYELAEKSYTVGIATKLDLRRAQIPRDAAQGNVARYTQLVAQDQNYLNLLAGGLVPDELLPLDLSSVALPHNISVDLPSTALLNRPDILAAEHQLKGAYAFTGAARAAFFPRISLTTTFGTASDELSGLFSSGTGTWNFAPMVTLPIFDSRTWAANRVSKADRQIFLAKYEKTIQSAFREVADALAVQGTVEQQLSAQQALTEAVIDTCHLAEKRYERGIDSYLSVLDAQRSLYEAQQGLITLRLVKLANRIHLYAVLGGGSPE